MLTIHNATSVLKEEYLNATYDLLWSNMLCCFAENTIVYNISAALVTQVNLLASFAKGTNNVIVRDCQLIGITHIINFFETLMVTQHFTVELLKATRNSKLNISKAAKVNVNFFNGRMKFFDKTMR